MAGSEALSQSSLSIGLFLGCLILLLPRRYALAPMLVAGCYMTLGQALLVGPMHLYLTRILILFAIARVVVRKELFAIDVSPIDRVLLVWLVVSSLLYVVVDGAY